MSKVEHVMELLKQRGYRRTQQREVIIGILSDSTTPLTAKEIHQRVQQRFPNVSLDTVYRNLELLRESGVVGQINLQNRESARFELHNAEEHHHHLVCVGCGLSVCIPVCPISPVHLQAAKEADFTVLNHAFELYGRCHDCAEGQSKNA